MAPDRLAQRRQLVARRHVATRMPIGVHQRVKLCRYLLLKLPIDNVRPFPGPTPEPPPRSNARPKDPTKVCRHSGLVRPIDSAVNAGIHTDIGIGFKAEKMEVSLDSPGVEGRAVETDCANYSGQRRRSRPLWTGRCTTMCSVICQKSTAYSVPAGKRFFREARKIATMRLKFGVHLGNPR